MEICEKPKGKIKYSVQAKLDRDGQIMDMKYKQVLIIREPPVTFRAGEEQKEVSRIKTCCCCDKGI